MRALQSLQTVVAALVVIAALPSQIVLACPFCSAASQTLRQEMTSMDVVGFAKLIPSDQETIDGQATFQVVKVVRGVELAKEGDTLVAPYFGPGKSDKEFLVMAVKSDELLWSSPLTLTESSRKYVESVFQLPEDAVVRLKFFYEFLDSPEPLLSGDAYDEFALAPYEEVKAARESFKKEELWSWLNDDTVSPDRKRLYYTLLGLVADESDAPKLEERLKSEDPNQRAGLDALIACYLTLVGEKGLPLIDDLFLKNPKSAYGDTYAAIQALRFQGTDGGAVKRDALLNSFRIMLDRPDYADLVIPDLARWEDWSQVAKVADLFEKADASTNWIRVPVINYLRVCPLPEAKEQLKRLEAIDPKSFQRANTFFPVPPATGPSPTDSSSIEPEAASPIVEMRSDTPTLVAYKHSPKKKDMLSPKSGAAGDVLQVESNEPPVVNQWKMAVVTLVASVNISLILGLVITGVSQPNSIGAKLRGFLHQHLS